jgi:NAD(P)-dependent dehydrogenase (short-subunit alcohol dehydrogenase family)
MILREPTEATVVALVALCSVAVSAISGSPFGALTIRHDRPARFVDRKPAAIPRHRRLGNHEYGNRVGIFRSPQLAMSGQYGAAKAALIFDTERWALEFVPHGIRVNTVSPGSILVEGNGWDRYRLANREYFEDYVRYGFPMGRLGAAEEVADVIVFIASPRAHWINGRNIPVDGLEQPHAPLDRRAH